MTDSIKDRRQSTYAQYDEKYFDGGKGYATYEEAWMWSAIPEMMGYLLGNTPTVLDFGCAKGFLVKNLVWRGVDAYGVDVSQYALDKAPTWIRNRLRLLRGPALPFPSGRFQVVTSFETLEHVHEEDIDITLQEIRRVGTKTFFGSIFLEGQVSGNDPTHVTVKPREWWDERFLTQGFQPDVLLVEKMREFPCLKAMRVEPFCYRIVCQGP